jgi:hypothetical protein
VLITKAPRALPPFTTGHVRFRQWQQAAARAAAGWHRRAAGLWCTPQTSEKGAETVPETVPEERRSSNEPEPPKRGIAVVLWLFAVLIAEVEAVLWLFERMYAQ